MAEEDFDVHLAAHSIGLCLHGALPALGTLFLQTVALVTQVAEAPGLGMLQAWCPQLPCFSIPASCTPALPRREGRLCSHAAQIQAASGLLGGDEQGQTCRKSMGEERRAPPLHAQEGLEGVDK